MFPALRGSSEGDQSLYAFFPPPGPDLYAVHRFSGSLGRRRSECDIGHRLFLDNGTLTPLLKKMEQTGYVRRIRSEEDERIVHVFLTEKGRSLKNELQDVPGQVGSCIPLTPEEAVTLYELLYKILAE